MEEPKFVVKYGEYMMSCTDHNEGVHYLFKLPNNLGLSIVKSATFSHDNWEAVQIVWDSEEFRIDLAWNFYYDADVIDGYAKNIDDNQIVEYFEKLMALPTVNVTLDNLNDTW